MKNLNAAEKIDKLIQEAWRIFMSQYLNGKYQISKEAPFQHYFANVIKSLGDLYCFSRSEVFLVDLETKEENIRGKNKYIDITFGFYDGVTLLAKGAMELKFKKKTQGADDFARIDAYEDIESLEHCLDQGYDTAYFCMIADYDIYLRESRPGTTGDIFSMRSGYVPPTNIPISNPNCKGRKDIVVSLRKEHLFEWESDGEIIYLCMPIHCSFS